MFLPAFKEEPANPEEFLRGCDLPYTQWLCQSNFSLLYYYAWKYTLKPFLLIQNSVY